MDYPRQMAKLQRTKSTVPTQGYSFSLIAAITQDCALAAQITEGGTDAVVFDNFLHRVLHKLRVDSSTKGKHIVVLMDNATIHRQEIVTKTVLGMKVFLLYTPQYSPQLNPVEKFFKYVKTKLRDQPSINK